MKASTKRIARLALMTALGFVILYIASILPSGKMATTAVAGFMTAVALMQYGRSWSLGVFAATAALGILILPTKGCAVFYTAFFGYYPIAKSLFERLANRWLVWLFKGLLYSASFAAWFFFADAVFSLGGTVIPWYGAWAIGAAAFVVYDVFLSKMIFFYIQKIAGYFK